MSKSKEDKELDEKIYEARLDLQYSRKMQEKAEKDLADIENWNGL